MSSRFVRIAVLMTSIAVAGARDVCAESVTIEPLSKEWTNFAIVTGFHSLVHKKSGLALRVLEADGSNSVAENPVSIFIVATNQGTSDLQEHVWRLPRGVVRVKKVTSSKCGLDILADVDGTGEKEPTPAKKLVIIRACFVDAKGELDSHLRLTETGSAASASQSKIQ